MSGRMSPFLWAWLVILMIFSILACAGTLPEQKASDRDQGMSDEEFVAAIKQQINFEVTEKDAVDSFDLSRGQVVKWVGNVYEIFDDKIHIIGSGEEKRYNYFAFLMDHPLPRQTRIDDMTKTVAVGDEICVVGRIKDAQDLILRTQVKVAASILEGYIISKSSDRHLQHPIWVGNKKAALNQGQ